jgi:6-phosphofructokinase 1
VRIATWGDVPHGSIVIERLDDDGEYRAGFTHTELSNVAKDTRDMPEEYLAGDNDVSEAFLDYALPLVGDMPRAARLSDFSIA